MRYTPGLLAAAFVAFLSLSVTSAHAQATRTWVSGVGDDANPCSRTAPCKTFAGAISKTAPAGEINVLDPGGFGAVTITKSISIISDSIEAGVLVSGTNGIIVNAGATDRILLSGLDIDGIGTGLNGVRILQAGNVTIRNSSIRNFTQAGIDMEATNAGARVYVQNTRLISNALGGFVLKGASGVQNNAVIEDSTFDLNGPIALNITGPASVILTKNAVGFSGTSLLLTNNPTVVSYGDNIFRGAGSPTQTVNRQ